MTTSVLNNIADCLRIPRSDIESALDTWTKADLIQHLEQFTADQLKPPSMRSG